MPDLRRSPTKVNFTHHNFTIWNDMLGEMMPVEVVHAKNVSVIHLIFSNVKRPIEPQYNLVFQQLLNTLKLECIWFQNTKSKTCARSDVYCLANIIKVQKYCLCGWNWAEWTDRGKKGTWLHTWRQNLDLPASDKKHQNGIKISIACFQIVFLCSLKDFHSTKQ